MTVRAYFCILGDKIENRLQNVALVIEYVKQGLRASLRVYVQAVSAGTEGGVFF
jgi:hypothetical protein